MLLDFARDPACRLCPLWEGCQSVCIPTRPWRPLPLPNKPVLSGEAMGLGPLDRHHALLIVGEAPGSREDAVDECHIGPAGTYLDHIYIRGMDLQCLAHVYVGNSARCRPPQNATPTTTQTRACLPYLAADLSALQDAYDRVTILCTGAVASRAVLNLTQKKSFGVQGLEVWQVGAGKACIRLDRAVHVFSTYHPAMLLPGRDPSRVVYVKRHLGLLCDYLRDGTLPGATAPSGNYTKAPWPPATCPRIVALDIETYGILKHHNQTVFHPAKSAHWDGAHRSRQIVTVALSWWKNPEEVHSAIFIFDAPAHRARLLKWLRAIRDSGATLLCMNTQFDVQYLRHCWVECRPILDHPMHLWDLAITNYLAEDSRPERSLKNLAPLYGVTRYEGEFRQYASPDNPELWAYNVQDAEATLRLESRLSAEIKTAYPDSPKLSPFARQWYSDLLWALIWMSEAGSTFNRPALEDLQRRLTIRVERLLLAYEKAFDEPLAGQGSQKGLLELFTGAMSATGSYELVEITAKTKRISTGEANLQLLLDRTKRHGRFGPRLRMLSRFRTAQKLLTSYVRPLLEGRGKDQLDKAPTLIGDRAYPSWYIVPSTIKGAETAEGGTNQARVTCKQPALQTAPPAIRHCFSTRFNPGVRIHADYSQLELKVAAILSGDPAFMHDVTHEDLHLRTSRLVGEVIGVLESELDAWAAKWRKWAGKVQNFRALYRGGVRMFQATLQKQGLVIALDDCRRVDRAFRSRYPVLWDWQESLIATAKSKGYVDLPLIGQSRRFLGSSRTIDKTYVQTIVNLPVQAVAACICESAQVAVGLQLRDRNLRSVTVLNCYDALDLECPLCESGLIKEMLQREMPNPAYYRALCAELGRTLPLTIDMEIIAERGLPNVPK